MRAFTIGHAARATGGEVQTVRSYGRIGLPPRPDRSEGNQRLHTKADVDRLGFIRHARDLGFSIEAIREHPRMADRPDMPCQEADALAARHPAGHGRADGEAGRSDVVDAAKLCRGHGRASSAGRRFPGSAAGLAGGPW